MADTRNDPSTFIEANREWVQRFGELGRLEVRPQRQLAILTCMDSRYTAQGILGVNLGDAHVIRNAGGRATDDAVRSLLLSAHALGTRTCVVIHHTKCGLYGTTNEAIRQTIGDATGGDASGIDFLPFKDLEGSVREDVERLRAHPLFPADYQVFGFVYDVESGRITPVDGSTDAGGGG